MNLIGVSLVVVVAVASYLGFYEAKERVIPAAPSVCGYSTGLPWLTSTLNSFALASKREKRCGSSGEDDPKSSGQ